MSRITKYGGGFLLGVLGMYAYALTLEPPQRAEPKPVRVESTSIAELRNAFGANYVAAERRYSDARLEVSATVAGVDRGPFGDVVVLLRSPGALESTARGISEDVAATLRPGQRVTLRCDFRSITLGSVDLRRCEL